MPDKKEIFGVAKGSPAVGIPLTVAALGRKAQQAHAEFAAKHPRIHAGHQRATREVKAAGRTAGRKVRSAGRAIRRLATRR